MANYIDRQAAIDALAEHEKSNGHNYTLFVDIVSECAEIIRDLPPAQPEQLEQCPIYGGMCAYPSDQCYDCPRHAGAKMGVTE